MSVSGILKTQSKDGHQTGWTAESDSRRLCLYMIVLDDINDRSRMYPKKSLKNHKKVLDKNKPM